VSSAVAHLPKGPPSNVEAEAALIGAMLMENDIARTAAVVLTPADFYEPTHGRLFARTLDLIAQGAKVTPVTLNPHFTHDEGLRALGGQVYLARLTGDGQGLLAPRNLAEQIRELAVRRRRLAWLEAEKSACIDVASPLGEITPPSDLVGASRSLQCLDLTALAAIEPEPKHFIIPRLAPAGEVTLFTGAGAVGKSLLAQQLATALAAGRSTLGLDLIRGPAIYITCEDDADQLHWRQAHICKALGVSMASLSGLLHLVSLRGQPDNALAAVGQDGSLSPAPLYGRVAALMRSTGARMACLDNVAHLFTGNENDRGDVTRFVNLLNRLAGDTGAAILLLGHPNKGGDTYSGSTAWLNAVRSQVTMERPKDAEHDPDLRAIHLGKPNYVQAGEALRCRWSEWAFIRDEDLPEDKREELSLVIAASAENEAFLACLRERTAQGESRAVGPNSGPNFAPAQFEGMPAARGFSKTALKTAMERLFTIGRIETRTYRNKEKGRDVTIIQEVQGLSPNAPRTLPSEIGADRADTGKNGGILRDAASPNASPNTSRTSSPNNPERRPNTPRTIPEHTPSPTERGGGSPDGGPLHPPQSDRSEP
jgi:RecA-family ATPase